MHPYIDPEVFNERIKNFIGLFSDEDCVRVNCEVTTFSLKSGLFKDLNFVASRFSIDIRNWWEYYGSSAPLI